MRHNKKTISGGGPIVLLIILLNGIVAEQAVVSGSEWYGLAFITLPLLVLALLFINKRIS